LPVGFQSVGEKFVGQDSEALSLRIG